VRESGTARMALGVEGSSASSIAAIEVKTRSDLEKGEGGESTERESPAPRNWNRNRKQRARVAATTYLKSKGEFI